MKMLDQILKSNIQKLGSGGLTDSKIFFQAPFVFEHDIKVEQRKFLKNILITTKAQLFMVRTARPALVLP